MASSLASILSVARSALAIQQRSVAVASHNVANATTPGYSRQRALLLAETPLQTPQGAIGRGVRSESVQRVRDYFLDVNYRAQSGLLGGFGASRNALQQVEAVLDELGDNGLAAGLAGLWDGFAELANSPASLTSRQQVVTNARELIRRFRSVSEGLGDAAQLAQQRLAAAADEITTLAAQIRDLNKEIQVVFRTGGSPDLEDRRDLAIDRLSQLVGVRVIRYDDGTVGVMAGQVMLADAQVARAVELRTGAGGVGLGLVGEAGTVDTGGGETRALATFASTTLPAIEGRLNELVVGVVTEVNALHMAGTTGPTGTTPGQTGVPFFSPGGLTAATIALAVDIEADAGNVVTGGTGNPGDNALALQLAQLRTRRLATPPFNGRSLGEFYTSVVGDVGVQLQAATRGMEAQEALVEQAEARRASVKDVSIDEEMISLVRFQQAYAAAARVVTVVDEMMDALLAMKR